MVSTLTSRERAHLKARAHALDPVVQTGKDGITDAVVAEIDRALTAHELLKVRIGGEDREARVALGDELCTRTGATSVDRVGKVLILWRKREEQPDAAAEAPTSPSPPEDVRPARPASARAPRASSGAPRGRGTPSRVPPRRRRS